MTSFETDVFEDSPSSTATKPAKPPVMWACVHCQEPVLKTAAIVYDEARVCRSRECVRVVILEDRYARSK